MDSREVIFTVRLWDVLNRYLRRYTVNGNRLIAKEPNSVVVKGKIPDIVITDEKGIPVLIIETKRKAEGRPSEEFLNPLAPAPIAQALCYAALAMEEYKLDRTPMYATANQSSLILFKGVSRDEVREIIDIDKCLEPKRAPEDWAKALKPGGLTTIINNYIIDRIEYPLRDEGVKKLFDYVAKWLSKTYIPVEMFYKVFVDGLRSLVEDLHEYIRDAVKNKALSDKEYFVKLYNKAVKSGYPYGLLSKGLLELKCPKHSEKICRYLKEVIEKEIGKARSLTPEKAYEILSSISRKHIIEICSEAEKAKKIKKESIPLCREPRRVEDLISLENLTKMMTYVLVNKILAYKILELHYGKHIPSLKLIPHKGMVKINEEEFRIESPDDVIRYLNHLFAYASLKLEKTLGIKDFTPIFITGLYDEIVLSGIESIKKINAVIDFIDSWKSELKKLPGIVGYVYEGLLSPKERHQLGQFYTPPAIARLITKWAIRTGSDRILDAGCGSGTFLIEAYKRLLHLKFNKKYDKGEYPSCTEEYNEHQDILNHLYGVDINAFATSITSIHLMLMEPRCPISKLNVETRDFFTLTSGSRAFGESHVGRFDAIIGNPPYTRWVEIPDETKEYIKQRLKNELSYYDLHADLRRGREPGIYVYWIMHATKNLLKDNGRIGMIISNMWLQTDYGVDFGRFLLDNFRIKALIDLSFRLFEALISTVIILAEKEVNSKLRSDNVVTLIRIPPKIKGVELDAENTGKTLDETLKCIEDSIGSDGSIDISLLDRCRKEYGIHYVQLKQGEIPRDRKWISLFFKGVDDILKEIEKHPLMIRLGEWFEPSYGNALYLCLTSWGKVSGVRNLGAKDFFYFSKGKVAEWERNKPGFAKEIKPYLVPAITRSQYIKTFTFTKEDWESIEKEGKDAYMFVCHKPRDDLPEQVQEYIRWGETECRTRIRGTRGGGRLCSEAEACKARAANPPIFHGWYDLGGYIPTPLMAIRQARYHSHFFMCTTPAVTYDAIITFIPLVRLETSFMKYEPLNYKEYLPKVRTDISLTETELKALLAYLNSTLIWLWLEQKARYIAKGPLGLEVSIAREIPVLNVKKLNKKDVEELAQLFDKLESAARASTQENKMDMFKELKSRFSEIDKKIAEILGLEIDTNWLWNIAWEMMERRVKGAKGPVRPGTEVSVEVEVKKKERKRKTSSNNIVPLDKWLS